MKKVTKLFMAALLAGMCSFGYAQTYEWQKPIQKGEKELELVLDTVYAGIFFSEPGGGGNDFRKTYSIEELYKHMHDKIKGKIGDTYPDFGLRMFKWRIEESVENDLYTSKGCWKDYYRRYYTSAIIVISDAPETVVNPLSKALDKALMEVREGSRIAIDQIRVPTGTNKEDYKDEVVEMLLDKGFKVVAKEYLERLYEEQQGQQSGIYNERTTVKENNLSAVGYYLNVKLTETSLRVQVVNVSTGEYDGNVNIKLQQ